MGGQKVPLVAGGAAAPIHGAPHACCSAGVVFDAHGVRQSMHAAGTPDVLPSLALRASSAVHLAVAVAAAVEP